MSHHTHAGYTESQSGLDVDITLKPHLDSPPKEAGCLDSSDRLQNNVNMEWQVLSDLYCQ